jgi:hypothetical protein
MTQDAWRALELGGISLDAVQRLPGALAVPPRLEVRDDVLVYSWHGPDVERVNGLPASQYVKWQVAQPTSGLMLRRFIELADGDDVLAFARRWGVLGICAHDRPRTHRATPAQFPINDRDSQTESLQQLCYPRGWFEAECSEPIGVWLRYAGQALAVLSIAAALRGGTPPTREDWQALYGDDPDFAKYDFERDAGSWLESVLNQWLVLSDTRPRVVLKPKPHIILVSGLFSAITLQLIAALGSARPSEVCSGCQSIYVPPRRRPKVGHRRYCPLCRRRGVPQQQASADYRAKKLKGIELAHTGKSPLTIAKALDTRVSVIRGWIAMTQRSRTSRISKRRRFNERLKKESRSEAARRRASTRRRT